jgi:AraC family transcriptional regulator
MEPRIVERETFCVLGVADDVDIRVDDPGKAFEESSRRRGEITAPSSAPGDYGVYFESDQPGKVCYLAGIEVDADSEVPEGLELRGVPGARYAVFECGIEEIGKTWRFIHGTWFPNSKQYALADSPVFEYFPPGARDGKANILIHVAVREKVG